MQNPYRELEKQLQELGSLFSLSESGLTARRYFEENLEANEFEVALHSLCGHILDEGRILAAADILKIEKLHSTMKIVDDCGERLRERAQTGDRPGVV